MAITNLTLQAVQNRDWLQKCLLKCVLLLIWSQCCFAEEIVPSQTIHIPMRDGVCLATDLYLPLGVEPSSAPCILVRSPAGRKGAFVVPYAYLSYAGYVVAIQDTRSVTFLKQFPFLSDGWGLLQDGYDTIEWLALSPYSNGKIGTVGVSAAGISQLMLAPTNPPHLVSQHIGVAASNLFDHVIFPGGQFSKDQVEGWLGYYQKDTGVQSFACTHFLFNDIWSHFDCDRLSHQVQVPAFFYGGWYDVFLQGTIDAFVARQERGGNAARGKQKLIIGPWSHYWPKIAALGDFQLLPEYMQCPVDIQPKAWFDATLKGENNGIQSIPAVTYYVMGPFDGSPSKGNVWRQAESWPIPCKPTPFYLHASKGLSCLKPTKAETYSYEYNPLDPMPTTGGRNLFLESGPKDQSTLEMRDDAVVFTTDPLDEDLEITGRIRAKIFFSSDCCDTDLVVRLTDVYPDGKSYTITDGLYRTGHDFFFADLNPAHPREIDVDLWSTSICFAKGHRIRVTITSSNYPRHEKNLNIGLVGNNTGDFKVAKNKIWVGEKTPSRLILPLIKNNNK